MRRRSCWATIVAAQQPAFKRTVVQQADLSTPGREVVQAVAEFQPGATPGRHTHPGEEVGYVIEGTFSVEQGDKPAVTLKAGQGFVIPAGTDSQRDQHRHGRRQDPRHLHRRKRQAARDAGAGEVADGLARKHESTQLAPSSYFVPCSCPECLYRNNHARIVFVTNSGSSACTKWPAVGTVAIVRSFST